MRRVVKINIQNSKTIKNKSFFQLIFLSEFFFIFFIQGLLGLQSAYAATYYVSPSGIDTNAGTSLLTPVKTINKALSKATLSGDVVYVLTGTYAEVVNIVGNGITLSAYSDNKPVIDGGTTLPSLDWDDLITVKGNNNIVSGFEVKNSNVNGTHLGGTGVRVNGQYNIISKINVHHTWDNGIYINASNNIVEDCTVYQATLMNSATPGVPEMWSAGLAVRTASDVILRRNTVFNNWGEGIIFFEADRGTIEDNIAYDNWTHNLYLSDASNSLVQRNIVYVSSAPAIPQRYDYHQGILLADENANVTHSSNNTIINNVVYNADFGAFSWTKVANTGLNNVLIANNTIVDGSFYTGSGGNPAIVNTNSQIRNNIILGTYSQVPSNSGITFSNNNWSATPPLAKTVTDVIGDPQIARTGTTTPGTLTSAYFKILGSSPVINAATPLDSINEDFFQVNRGTEPDIGGHEFQSGNNAIDSTAPSAPSGLSATASSSAKVDLAWSASTDNVGVAGYRIYRDGTEIGTSTVASFADTSVAGGTTYNYTVKASDVAGNLSASSNTATVKTVSLATVKITSYSVGNITSNSAVINWTTDAPSSGEVSYGTSASGLASKVTVSNLTTSQSIKITGLKRRTTYYYQIKANNGSATALSNTTSFRTGR